MSITTGRASSPVCWSLVGYSSGFVSACMGKEDLLSRDRLRRDRAQRHCSAIGRDAESWGADARSHSRRLSGGAISDTRSSACATRSASASRNSTAGRRLLERRERELNLLRERVNRHAAAKHFIAGSAAMQDVLELAARVAPLDTTVLVYGESGTGKEFIVRMIHDQSPRASAPFVSINCAALTETLLESELFGHVRGAFTGAVRDKAGLFEVAGSGTIFLDEIGEVAPTVQAKLLRALQEREIRRVGAERSIKVNARVVAATNRDLRAAVDAGTFREDLYFRLGAFVITVPPLRDRREDIPPLVHSFLVRAASRMKKDVGAVSADAMTALMNYRWPGNVRELEHAVERAVILANGRQYPRARAAAGGHAEVPSARRRRHARPAGTGTGHDRARPRTIWWQSPQGRRGAEDQHRDALAEDEAVRHFILKVFVSLRNGPRPTPRHSFQNTHQKARYLLACALLSS